ncbi:MAG: hypothetical protein ACYC23_24220 [Limisphaerales bacterium]
MAKVEQRMAMVDALETQLAASRATATNLLSALPQRLRQQPHHRLVIRAVAEKYIVSECGRQVQTSRNR